MSRGRGSGPGERAGRRVLVTGAEGFVGRHAVLELRRRGWRVLAAGRRDADLRDAAAAAALVRAARPRVVLHAAGSTLGSDWGALWDANVATTVNVLSAVPPGVRAVIAGSSAEYGAAAGRKPLREDAECLPLGPYGSSKLSQTLAALSFRHRGLDVAVARIFNTSGPGGPDTLIPGAFARQLAEGASVLRTGDLSPARDFVDIRDAARALADLCEPGVPGGVYNVATGRGTPIRAVVELLVRLAGRRVRVERDPARRRAKGADIPFIAGDASKLRRATGWKPRFSLEQSLRDALAAFESPARA